MVEYWQRLLDQLLAEMVAELPASLVVGLRAIGMTTTAAWHARTIVRLDREAEPAAFRAEPVAASWDLPEPVLLEQSARWANTPRSCSSPNTRYRPKVIDPITGYVRVKAVCLFVKGDLLLAINGFDPTKRQRFWVPVGGRVEFGELSRRTIAREVREELSAEITELNLLGVLENVFRFDGSPGHEVVFVYDARFVDSSIYLLSEITGVEGDEEFTAHWIDPNAPKNGWPLYPEGLPGLLGNESNRPVG